MAGHRLPGPGGDRARLRDVGVAPAPLRLGHRGAFRAPRSLRGRRRLRAGLPRTLQRSAPGRHGARDARSRRHRHGRARCAIIRTHSHPDPRAEEKVSSTMTSAEPVASEPALSEARRWAITATVMLVSVLQILDTSITNVAQIG